MGQMQLEFQNGLITNEKFDFTSIFVMDGGKPSVCKDYSECVNVEDHVIGFSGMSCVQNYAKKGKLHYCSTNIITRACCETTKSVCFGVSTSTDTSVGGEMVGKTVLRMKQRGTKVIFYGFI